MKNARNKTPFNYFIFQLCVFVSWWPDRYSFSELKEPRFYVKNNIGFPFLIPSRVTVFLDRILVHKLRILNYIDFGEKYRPQSGASSIKTTDRETFRVWRLISGNVY